MGGKYETITGYLA